MRRRLRRLWRLVLALLWVRRFTPAPWERLPGPEDTGGPTDTAASTTYYRPPHRPQDPAKDPREPFGGESSSRGNDHGWSGCTMSATAMALAYAKQGGTYWGGDMRHHQSDLDGGTDLYDARDAFAAYGETLTIRSGAGWAELQEDRRAGRMLVVQGSGNVPGSATFDGGHACALSPETQSDGDWLFGDPLATGWQWVTPSSIRTWMEAWAGSGLAWARTVGYSLPEPPDPTPEPTPPPPPPPDRYPEGYQDGAADGRTYGQAEALDAVFGSWLVASDPTTWEAWDGAAWDEDGWASVPYPLLQLQASRTPATWGGSTWTGATWRDPEAPSDLGWDLVQWAAPWAA